MDHNQFGQPVGAMLEGWQPAGEPGKQTLQGRFCCLQPMDIARRAEELFDAYQLAEAALRLGFTFEGTFRQATTRKGRSRDSDWLSIIDGEWPQLREAFTAWLSPLNIATDGQQKQRLATFKPRPGKPASTPVPE